MGWPMAWLVFASIAVAAALYFALVVVPGERAAAIEVWRGRLSAMVDDRKAAIAAWLDERLDDARLLAGYPMVAALLAGEDGAPHPRPPSELPQQQLQVMLDSVRVAYGYSGLYVVDANGQVLASSPGGTSLGASCRQYNEHVLQSGVEQVDFHSHEDGSPMVAVVAPVWAGGRPIGTVLLSMDPGRWLYPLLRSEPIPSSSAETLLVRQMGGQIEFLSPLRHRSARPMSFRLPVNAAPLAAVAAVHGEEGLKEYSDYRGVAVLGAARHIAGTGWGLVVKVDRNEVLAGFGRNVRQGAFAIAGLLLAVAGLGFGAQRALAARHRRELGEGEARFALLRDHANDGIWFVSSDGTIRDANVSAASMHGCTREEFIGHNAREFRPAEDPAAMPSLMDAIRRGEEATFETVHARPDGSIFPIEVSSRVVQLDGEEVFLSVYRDISERKRQEARITQLNRLLRTISEINQVVVRESDRDRLLAEACRIVVEHGGFRMAWIGFADEASGTVKPAASAGFEEGYLGSITVRYDDTPLGQSPVGRAIRDGIPAVVNDWEADERMAPWREIARSRGYRSSAAFALKVGGRVKGAFTVYSSAPNAFDGESVSLLEEMAGDIGFALDAMDTEAGRQAAGRALAAQHSTLRGIIESTAALIFSVDREYRYTSFNGGHAAVMKALYGAEVELGRSLLACMTVEDDRRQASLNIDRALAGERFVTEAASGEKALTRSIFEVSHNPIRDADGTVIGVAVFAADVSERRRAEEALQESRALMQDVLDNSSSLIYIIDTEGRILFANSRLESVLGAPRAVLRGKTRHELMPKGIADHHRANDLAVIAEGRSSGFEETNEEPDGQHIYWTVKFPLRDGQGQTYAIGGMSTDVTEHKRAEEALRLAHERLRRFIDSNMVGIVIASAGGEVIEANDYYLRLIGLTRENLAQGKVDWRAITPPEWIPADEKAIRELRERGTCTPYEKEYLRKDGTRVWVLLADAMLPGPGEQIAAFVIDISDRKHAEAELRESERRYRAIGESIDYGVWVCAADGRNTYASESFLKMVGITQEQCSNFGWGNVLHPEDADRTVAAWQECVRTGGTWDIEHRFRGVDGEWHAVLARGVPVRDDQGQVVSWAGINLDISNLKHAEDEIRRLNADLEERVRQRTAELEASNSELEAFSYSVSHDLRAPLRAIDGFSRIVLDDYGNRLDDEGKRQLGVIRANTQRMGQLIDDLLAFSRAGRTALNYSRVAMESVVRAAFAEVAVDPEEQGRIDLSIGELPDAWADPALIHQVWVNLLSNAVKFSRPRERAVIRVTGARADHRGLYHVNDNGVGFDMRFADKLFGVFQRLHSSHDFEGTGVGLALVHRILHRHGGEVWGEGVVDGGATFSFTLPEEAEHERL